MGGRCVARPLRRSGAQPGDVLWVTGTPGLAGAGYVLADPPAAALRALRRPRPPLAYALALATAGLPTATMDLSDGLASDLPRLCRASGVGAEVDPRRLPAHPDLLGRPDLLTLQAAAGDDYELLFAASRANTERLRALAAEHQVSVTEIGTICGSGSARLLGAAWPEPPFSHFGGAT
jgi:thiamine-monophosphate kinase